MHLRHHGPDALRIELANALGFARYPADATAEPYLNYITNCHVDRGSIEEYTRLFIRVIQYFQLEAVEKNGQSAPRTIDGLLVKLTVSGHGKGHGDLLDSALYIIGVWTMMRSSFVHVPIAGGLRKVTVAYALRAQDPASGGCEPYADSLPGLMVGSGLLPVAEVPSGANATGSSEGNVQAAIRLLAYLSPRRPPIGTPTPSSSGILDPAKDIDAQEGGMLALLDNLDSLESLSISATRLNAYTLGVFGSVEIVWTHNVSRHLMLSKRDGRHSLEVFALPCALTATSLSPETVGISTALCQEIKESYSSLFSPWPNTLRHARFSRMLGIEKLCWCWSCSAQRHQRQTVTAYRKFSHQSIKLRPNVSQSSEFDPYLIRLMKNEPSDWTPDDFPCLWSRITMLEQHLQAAKPLSIWVLFWDRRDTLQFWTFFFATMVLGLTILQVFLGVAQVAGSFVH
ncbi:hypothetical protein T440DRAFT_467688 [Plenodomus tracheiphilus IPT5]|uniref:Uncharacterized protein n=1 Tax=Plenodomus tracheiphilus IPT5 TaxID=1408161 RepID=A0A6A7B849_9PLEO|nr:hypothetical protein T440DRAFT_467688 [Plenodomus tracheiphilus IPT5]